MSGGRVEVSVVVPAFNERESLPILVSALKEQLSTCESFELLIVDDGSSDGSLEFLTRAGEADPRIRYVALSRNFGHQAALRAGLAHSSGSCVISMDADLQHPVTLLEEMIERWRSGDAIVNTIRLDPPSLPYFKRLTSRTFYRVLNFLSDVQIDPGSADFRLLDRKVVDVINGLSESELFMRGLMPWLGFSASYVRYTPNPRLHGVTKYRWRKMVSLAMTGIISNSIQPLRLATLLAMTIAGLAGLYGIYAIIAYFWLGHTVPGWASVVLAVCVIGSLQLLVLGVIGEYVGRILRESRKRPAYVVARSNVAALESSNASCSSRSQSIQNTTHERGFAE